MIKEKMAVRKGGLVTVTIEVLQSQADIARAVDAIQAKLAEAEVEEIASAPPAVESKTVDPSIRPRICPRCDTSFLGVVDDCTLYGGEYVLAQLHCANPACNNRWQVRFDATVKSTNVPDDKRRDLPLNAKGK